MTIRDIRPKTGPLYFPSFKPTCAPAVVCQSRGWRSRMEQAVSPGPRKLLTALVLVATLAAGCRAVSTDAGATSASADVERLKTLVPSQSHAMMDVAFHWTNLWFAGQQGNWPLARFYFDEARQHIQWTIRIRPIRKDPDNRDVD